MYARQLQISFDRNYLIFVTLKSIWCPKWPISRQSCFYCLRFATTLLLSANLFYVRKNGKIIEINIFLQLFQCNANFENYFFWERIQIFSFNKPIFIELSTYAYAFLQFFNLVYFQSVLLYIWLMVHLIRSFFGLYSGNIQRYFESSLCHFSTEKKLILERWWFASRAFFCFEIELVV